MEPIFPVRSSLLSAEAISTEVLPQFGLSPDSKCEYFSGGFSHTYRITTPSGTIYYLKSYRKNWRTLEDVKCEMDALNYLKEKGFPATHPVKTLSGNFHYSVNAPEGQRNLVLLTLAPGNEITYENEPEKIAENYGQAEALMHNALEGFQSPYNRFQLDLDYFTIKPLETIETFLKDKPKDWEFIKNFADTLRSKILALPVSELEMGFCHGDLQGYHANVNQDGVFTFFDFDCGGYGFRAYDLAVFLWCCRLEDTVSTRWQPFLDAYKSKRRLSMVDEKAIPLFVCARYLWHIGVHTFNAPDWGIDFLNENYFKDHLGRLHKAAEDYLN